VAILFALRGSAASSIGTLVSSAVNQWTLLVGALPAAYAISHGSWAPMILDGRQREEVLLTSAQSIFALVIISNFKFSVFEALVLLGLFVPQLFFTSPAARWVHAFLYLALAAGVVVVYPGARRGVLELLPIPGRRRRTD
jgi:cation:H+ antiporter